MVAVSSMRLFEIGEGLVLRDLGWLVHEAGGVFEMEVFEAFGYAGPAVGAGDFESFCLFGGFSFAGHGLRGLKLGVLKYRGWGFLGIVWVLQLFFLTVHCRIIDSVWKARLDCLRRKSSELIEYKQFPEAHIDRQSSSEIVDRT